MPGLIFVSWYISTLQNLGLPSSLEALVQPTGLPDSILAKAEEIQHEGGCEALNKMLENVEMLSIKNAALIDEAINQLGKEHDEDDRLRRRFRLGKRYHDFQKYSNISSLFSN
jgi:programmed cell death 6-interacting protein